MPASRSPAKVSTQTIAMELGVSKNTVSRALRGLSGVSSDTRRRIITRASENGYIQGGKPGTMLHITMLYRKSLASDVYFWPAVLSGVMDYAADKGVSISAIAVDEAKDCGAAIRTVKEQACDGLLVVSDVDESFLCQLAELRLPLVVVDYFSPHVDCDYVNTANHGGIQKALAYLTANNHSRIGFLGNTSRLFSFEERYSAYRLYMNAHGWAIDERFVWLDANYEDYDYFRRKLDPFKQSTLPVTAFICVNDIMAMGFSRVLRDYGYSIPADISIVGFDNAQYGIEPMFTTLEVQKKALGQRALEQLLCRISMPHKPYERLQISTTLIVRGSVKHLCT